MYTHFPPTLTYDTHTPRDTYTPHLPHHTVTHSVAYQIKSISLYFHSQVFRKQICHKMHFRRLRLCCVHVWKDSYSDNWETVLPTMQSHREHSPFTGMYFVTTRYISLSSICLGPVSRQISLTFWVEANESIYLVVLMRLINKWNGRNVFITCVNLYWFFHTVYNRKSQLWQVWCTVEKYLHSTQPRWRKRASRHLETRSRSNINGAYAYRKTHTWSNSVFGCKFLSGWFWWYLWPRIALKMPQEFPSASLDITWILFQQPCRPDFDNTRRILNLLSAPR